MKARRMLNMVTETIGGGSLSRINAGHHLFYRSTAQAQHHRQIEQQQGGAAAAQKDEDYDGVLPLPRQKLRVEPSPSEKTSTLGFFPLGGEGSKIVCVDDAGHSLLYDADACTVHTMPSLGIPTLLLSPASFAVSRTADAHDPDRPDALYLLDNTPGNDNFQFQALVYGNPDRDLQPRPDFHRSFGWLDIARRNFAWHWRQLSPPPVHDHDRDSTFSLESYALLHGSTICVSINRRSERYTDSCGAGGGTYFFDTGAGEWIKSGDWTLPFNYPRALHVPELGEDLLFGIKDLRFCAVDISDAMKTTTKNGASSSAPPVLRHAWPFSDPTPEDWYPSQQDSVAYLGAGRFCIHRGFDIMATDGYGDPYAADTAALLTGVEVMRDAESSRLRMVRHKTKRIEFIHHLL